jgi:hypothetical protein
MIYHFFAYYMMIFFNLSIIIVLILRLIPACQAYFPFAHLR